MTLDDTLLGALVLHERLGAAGPDCRDMEIYISRTPANATITGGPSRTNASPSAVTFSFVPEINNSFGAPIASAQCLIQDAADQPQVSALCLSGSTPCGI